MNRRVVGDMLDVAGATMTGAESAELGLQLIDENDYAIVLIDLRMPGMDGITAIQHIRARPDDKAALPIIVVTADTAVDLRERTLPVQGCCQGPIFGVNTLFGRLANRFELHVCSDSVEFFWDVLMDAGQEFGLRPAGVEGLR